MIVPSDAPKYNLRIPAEIKEIIEKSAKDEGRSVIAKLQRG